MSDPVLDFSTGRVAPTSGGWGAGILRFVACLVLMLSIAMVARPVAAQGLFGGSSDEGDRRNAEAAVRLNQMEGQMRALNGQVEQLTFQIRSLQDTLTRMQKDYDFRLQELENGGARGGGAAVAKPPLKKSEAPVSSDPSLGAVATMDEDGAVIAAPSSPARGAPPAALGRLSSTDPIGGLIGSAPMDLGAPGARAGNGSGGNRAAVTDTPAPVPGVDPRYASAQAPASPRDEYDAAYGYILNGEYDLAEQSFKTFMANHPTDKRIGAAQFWLGESYFARSRPKEAADAFLKSYTQFPDGPKAPDSLLKLGLSLSNLGEKKAACASFEELLGKYPKASKAVRDRAAAEKTRGKC